MIKLVTGIPGSGKTAYVVAELLKVKDRPIFVDGIPDLTIDHQPCPPLSEWTELRNDKSSASGTKVCFTFPANAIIVIDECQRVYRPRPSGSRVPPEVAAFETHRHEGLDFILITQNPTLLDANVRKLIGCHVHFRVTWAGRYCHEWGEVADVESSVARSLSVTTKYKLPKEAFGAYKSAVLHTKHRQKIPFAAYLLVACVVGFSVVGWQMYKRFQAIQNPPSVAPVSSVTPVSVDSPSGPGAASRPASASEYLGQFRPRITGLPHTAPVYDGITQAVDVPEPVGCVDSKLTGCKCYTQQGTVYQTTEPLCRQIMKDGMFIHWRPRDSAVPDRLSGGSAPAPDVPRIHVIGSPAPSAPASPVPGI